MHTNKLTPLVAYLGKQSYPAILSNIVNTVRDAKADTIVGNELLSNFYKNLNESASPIMQIKEFTTNAEQVASNDAKLIDIVNFARKEVKSGDLNFLINVVKEQHLQNLSRTGFPSPEKTLEEIKMYFDEPASVIEQGIRNGIFDGLDSDLLNELKNDIIEDKSKNVINKDVDINSLNESYLFGNTAIYSPVGIKLEDIQNGRVVLLTESCVLTMSDDTNELFQELEPQSIAIPLAHKRLMTALSGLDYDPQANQFSLTEPWDFELQIREGGKVVMGKQGVDRQIYVENADVPELLLESMKNYADSVPNFNKTAFAQDADNFIMLMENYSKLIRLDECKTIKNLDTNEFVMVNLNESKKPRLIASSKQDKFIFESYSLLAEEISNIVENNVAKLFESQMDFEVKQTNLRFTKINELREAQKELNILISSNRRLKEIAEKDSPAMDQLFEQSQKLDFALKSNLDNISKLENTFAFYN